MNKETQVRRVPRFHIRGVTGAMTIPQEAEVLDLSVRGALMEHQGMLRVDAPCIRSYGARKDQETGGL